MYKLGEFSKIVNVHPKTLIYWDNNDILNANRTKTGRRYYTESMAEDYLGIPSKRHITKTVLYSRVSTRSQKEDLKNQEEYLKEYCKRNGIPYDDLIQDYGSGLNYKRKEFNRVIKEVEEGKISKIIITHKDRLIRFGYDWFKLFCERHSCEIVVLDNTEKDIHSELVEDLISIVHVFSCRLYGLRNYKRKTKLEKVIENEIKNVKS